MIHILIVEDDDEQATLLESMLERYSAEKGVELAVTRDANAFALYDDKRPFDLIFLDIGLPGIDGLEGAAAIRLRDAQVPIIFVTDLAQYAVRGYEVNALDFVVKPVTYGGIARRMDKALAVIAASSRRTISLATPTGVRVIPLDRLVYVDISHHDLYYHVLGSDDTPRVRGTMAAAEAELADAPFVRISASCLANMALIRQIDGDRLVMEGGTELWFTRGKKKPAMERIARYLGGMR